MPHGRKGPRRGRDQTATIVRECRKNQQEKRNGRGGRPAAGARRSTPQGRTQATPRRGALPARPLARSAHIGRERPSVWSAAKLDVLRLKCGPRISNKAERCPSAETTPAAGIPDRSAPRALKPSLSRRAKQPARRIAAMRATPTRTAKREREEAARRERDEATRPSPTPSMPRSRKNRPLARAFQKQSFPSRDAKRGRRFACAMKRGLGLSWLCDFSGSVPERSDKGQTSCDFFAFVPAVRRKGAFWLLRREPGPLGKQIGKRLCAGCGNDSALTCANARENFEPQS